MSHPGPLGSRPRLMGCARIDYEVRIPKCGWESTGLLSVSWSSDNGSHMVFGSLDDGSDKSSSIGIYLTQVTENPAGVLYLRELCGRSVFCHSHYFREAAKPIYEADRHAKKELEERVRGIRKIEHRAEEGSEGGEADAEAEVVRGYLRRGAGRLDRGAQRGLEPGAQRGLEPGAQRGLEPIRWLEGIWIRFESLPRDSRPGPAGPPAVGPDRLAPNRSGRAGRAAAGPPGRGRDHPTTFGDVYLSAALHPGGGIAVGSRRWSSLRPRAVVPRAHERSWRDCSR